MDLPIKLHQIEIVVRLVDRRLCPLQYCICFATTLAIVASIRTSCYFHGLMAFSTDTLRRYCHKSGTATSEKRDYICPFSRDVSRRSPTFVGLERRLGILSETSTYSLTDSVVVAVCTLGCVPLVCHRESLKPSRSEEIGSRD